MSSRTFPLMLAIGVGVVSGFYIWNEPLKQETSQYRPKDLDNAKEMGKPKELDQPTNSPESVARSDTKPESTISKVVEAVTGEAPAKRR